jgi:hypothetical protein
MEVVRASLPQRYTSREQYTIGMVAGRNLMNPEAVAADRIALENLCIP